MTEILINDGAKLRYELSREFNGQRLSAVIESLNKMADGMSDPVFYITEMGDVVELQEVKSPADPAQPGQSPDPR